ncbi:unnamed protein product [Adineta steineri]|uniref:G-protein coupled receptors family 1 profile domain-containing protein n=1 Tax=Adineta steineri TaxID=433720 RepID=A0A815MEX9_9BILA|nr:unnamed protein product [Adineta steineri]CAF4089550.1 unnamed protein product [Adineta steineri]
MSNEKDLGNPLELRISVYARFWLYLIPSALSLLCSFFVLFHLLFDRTLRQALNNHIIIVLLLIGLLYEVVSVPLMLYWYQYGNTWIFPLSFAHFWTLVDYFCYSTQLVGFAWASIERHILIFHSQWVSTKKKRFLVHYLPLIVVLVYSFIYYLVIIVFPFCQEVIIQSPFNGVPMSCVLANPFFYKYNTISHQFLPVSLIIILNIALFLRVIWQKSRMNRSIEWRKQRKMTIQLLSASILYFIFMGPRTIFQFCRFLGLATNDILVLYYHSAFFANYIMFLFPFVCCASMPELGKKLKKILFCQRQRQVIVPIPLPTKNTTNKRTDQIRITAH